MKTQNVSILNFFSFSFYRGFISIYRLWETEVNPRNLMQRILVYYAMALSIPDYSAEMHISHLAQGQLQNEYINTQPIIAVNAEF